MNIRSFSPPVSFSLSYPFLSLPFISCPVLSSSILLFFFPPPLPPLQVSFPFWGLMCGSMPIISSTRTCDQTTWRPYGMWSTGRTSANGLQLPRSRPRSTHLSAYEHTHTYTNIFKSYFKWLQNAQITHPAPKSYRDKVGHAIDGEDVGGGSTAHYLEGKSKK